jgi:uncharacterized membrane protein YdjX (TVP38/TMEM64 family)
MVGKRFVLLLIGLSLLLGLPFALWGDHFEALWSGTGGAERLRSYGPWAWAIGLALLVGDLVLPVPSTAVMSALGYLYGPWWGGLLSAVGSFASGTIGYLGSRAWGKTWAQRLLGPGEIQRARSLFDKSGGWLVALSRCLPLMPEVVACLAGLSRMPSARFFLALACGAVPIGFVFALIGATGQNRPALALALSVIIPVLLWAMAQHWQKSRSVRSARRT